MGEPICYAYAFVVFQKHLLKHKDVHEWFSWFQQQKHEGVKFIAAQLELTPTKKKLHVQGYIHFSRKKRPSTVGRLYQVKPEAFRKKKAKATPADNRAYCTDEEKRLPV